MKEIKKNNELENKAGGRKAFDIEVVVPTCEKCGAPLAELIPNGSGFTMSYFDDPSFTLCAKCRGAK